ncbi:MAG: hypothetical protein AAB418_05110 [candidate division NC10 bacterium]|jgi:hypothetical protein
MAKRRDLYIVATDRKDLYEILKRQFAGNDNVEVVLDRRRGQRRQATGASAAEKRRAERRLASEAHLLKTLGVVLVSRDRDEMEARADARASRRGKGA